MKWHRNDYLDHMTSATAQRPFFTELFGPLVGLDEQWRQQGASEDEINMVGFDWDYVETADCGGRCGPIRIPPSVTIREDDRMLIERDGLGRIMHLDKTTATIALPQSYPVQTMDDWLAIKERHYLFAAERVNADAVQLARERQKQGAMVRAGIAGVFSTLRDLMGEEHACLAFYDQPELIHDIVQSLQEISVRVLRDVSEQVVIDHLGVHEDFAGKSGPMFSPACFRQFFHPYYQACWEVVKSHGTPCFGIDSDGDIHPLLDVLQACGVNQMHPCEPAAGMDMVRIRERYGPALAIKGGIDKFALLGTREDIRRELEYKMQPMMRQSGGIVFALDHRIPNGVPLEHYRYYVQLGREILGLAPRDPARRGWARMAF